MKEAPPSPAGLPCPQPDRDQFRTPACEQLINPLPKTISSLNTKSLLLSVLAEF